MFFEFVLLFSSFGAIRESAYFNSAPSPTALIYSNPECYFSLKEKAQWALSAVGTCAKDILSTEFPFSFLKPYLTNESPRRTILLRGLDRKSRLAELNAVHDEIFSGLSQVQEGQKKSSHLSPFSRIHLSEQYEYGNFKRHFIAPT